MTKVNKLVDRGLPAPAPASAPRSRGVGDLTNTVVPSGKPVNNAIPQDEQATIVGMEELAEDGTTAGSEGDPQDPRFAPGSHRSNIPGGVGNLIAPDTYNVP
jgi:hypothetical protein